jgi:HAD superfamily hydrolase (TIGR01458 family)
MVRGVLLDLSGVLYVGGQPLAGALDALGRLRAGGLALRFVTNTTRSTRDQILAQLTGMGFGVDADEVFTAPLAARAYLQARRLRPYLLVHPNLFPEFEDLEEDAPNTVLVGDAGEGFTYADMNRAFRLLMEGAPLVAMARNRYFQEADGLSLDAGPFVAALEYAAGVEAVVTGKPAAEFFQAACASLGCTPEDTVMVGDDVDADVNGATAAGLQGVLVQTGKYRTGDEQHLNGPDAIVLPDVAAVADWLLERATGRDDS